ncbi:MAG: transcriptional regulator [Mesorhizobium sp.]|nr:MAG: transcriptional regulator [Mesorhizobium sp.]
MTASVVSAYIANNPLPAAELPEFIGKIYASIKLISIGSLDVQPHEIKGVARAKKSVTPEFIICLEDGKRFKSLKRHIKAQYGLTPDQYRAKWNLPSNYPMVAPNYSATRRSIGCQYQSEWSARQARRHTRAQLSGPFQGRYCSRRLSFGSAGTCYVP